MSLAKYSTEWFLSLPVGLQESATEPVLLPGFLLKVNLNRVMLGGMKKEINE